MERLLHHPELVLRVLELSDVTDIAVLLKIPVFNKYIEKYKTSITKEQQSVFLLPAGWAGTPALITHSPRYPTMAESAGSLMDYCCNTAVRFKDTWIAVKIMRGRNVEINSLLNTTNNLCLCPDITWPQLEDKTVPKLRRTLCKALSICDAIFDIEAHIVVEQNVPLAQYGYIPRGVYPLTREDTQQSKLPSERYLIECLIPSQTRERQSEFVQTLSDADLLALWTLCYLASEAFHTQYNFASRDYRSMAVINRRAFKHCILSYGSYFLYGQAYSFDARQEHVRNLLHSVRREFMPDDDSVADRLPAGALAAMYNTLMKRFEAKFGDVDDSMLELLAVQVLGVEKKAFDNPPSATV